MTVVIAVPGSDKQARELAKRLDATLLVPEVRQFPDGELYVRIDGDVKGSDVVIVGSLVDPGAGSESRPLQFGPGHRFLLIAFLAGTARDLGARRVGLVAPYLSYLRQDSRFKTGEGVTATYFARLMSQVVDWLVTVDPHLHRLDSLDHVYSIPTTIARAAPSIARYIATKIENPVLVGPDAESVQWVSAVAAGCKAPFVILEKTRRGDRDVSISMPDQAWNGHTPVLIDDIVSTGKTMVEATRQLRAAGSAPPVCIAIHAVFADAVNDELMLAGAKGIVTCDTIPHSTNQIGVADPIAEAVRVRLAPE